MRSTKPTLCNAARRERLRRYAGWTAADLEEFDAAMRAQRFVDARSWNDVGREGRSGDQRVLPPPCGLPRSLS